MSKDESKVFSDHSPEKEFPEEENDIWRSVPSGKNSRSTSPKRSPTEGYLRFLQGVGTNATVYTPSEAASPPLGKPTPSKILFSPPAKQSSTEKSKNHQSSFAVLMCFMNDFRNYMLYDKNAKKQVYFFILLLCASALIGITKLVLPVPATLKHDKNINLPISASAKAGMIDTVLPEKNSFVASVTTTNDHKFNLPKTVTTTTSQIASKVRNNMQAMTVAVRNKFENFVKGVVQNIFHGVTTQFMKGLSGLKNIIQRDQSQF